MLPLLVAMVVGPMLKWKRAESDRGAGRGSNGQALVSAAVVLLVLARYTWSRLYLRRSRWGWRPGWSPARWPCWLIASASGARLSRRACKLARTTPRSFYGLVIAHAGVGLTVAGITGMSSWATEKVLMMRPGAGDRLAGYEFKLASVTRVPGPNYTADRAVFDVSRSSRPVSEIVSERRFFPVRQQQTTSAGISWGLVSNLYVSLGEPDQDGAWSVRLYHHPLVTWIWLGALAMAVGGFVSLFDRRLRVGAPQRARQPAGPGTSGIGAEPMQRLVALVPLLLFAAVSDRARLQPDQRSAAHAVDADRQAGAGFALPPLGDARARALPSADLTARSRCSTCSRRGARAAGSSTPR